LDVEFTYELAGRGGRNHVLEFIQAMATAEVR
jgi:hypothetical protein